MSDKASPNQRRLRAGLAAALLAGTALTGFAAGHFALAAPTPPPRPSPARRPGCAARFPTSPTWSRGVKPAVVSITTELRSHPTSDERSRPRSA